MHLIESPESNLKRYIPADLSECDSQQYIDMCELLFKFHTQQITADEMLTHSVYKLMNMKPVDSTSDEDYENKMSNVILIQKLIEDSFFIKEETETGYNLKIHQNYIHNPVPEYKPLWRTYHGPSDGFKNVKIGEYTDALKLFLQFNATGDMEILYEFVATLYRPKKLFYFAYKYLPKFDGDCRIRYNANLLEKRKKAFKSAPIGFIYGVYLYFASFQIIVASGQITWGDKELDLSILFSGGSSSPVIDAADLGLDSIVFAMAESGAFGDFEKVQKTPFWTMMIKMYDSRIGQLKEEKLHENAKSKSS